VMAGQQQPALHARESRWYRYWGLRMSVAKNIFDQAEPNTLSQWWHDTRNSSRRTTFWIGALGILLAVFFGLIQSITGIIQSARPA
jgi:Ni/Fe-hydrogenase subunit HybB-like protein